MCHWRCHLFSTHQHSSHLLVDFGRWRPGSYHLSLFIHRCQQHPMVNNLGLQSEQSTTKREFHDGSVCSTQELLARLDECVPSVLTHL